jgi:hypothetical protein
LSHADHALLTVVERSEQSNVADSAFNLLREALARYPIPSTRESRNKHTAFMEAYSKDEAAVKCLARLKEKVTPIVSICYFPILIVLTVYHQRRAVTKPRNKKIDFVIATSSLLREHRSSVVVQG